MFRVTLISLLMLGSCFAENPYSLVEDPFDMYSRMGTAKDGKVFYDTESETWILLYEDHFFAIDPIHFHECPCRASM